jgi:hypothetical protein
MLSSKKDIDIGCSLTIVFDCENQGTVSVWIRCNRHLSYQMDVKSTVSYHFYLNSKGYRALIYRFDHIPICPFLHVLFASSANLQKNK